MNQDFSDAKDRLFWRRGKFTTLPVILLSLFITGWLGLYVFELRPFSSNYGSLLAPPKALNWPALETLEGERFENGFGRKWTLLLFAGEACTERCRSNLFHMRQLRISLGLDTLRLQNVLVTASPLDETTRVYLQEFPNLKIIENNRGAALYDQFAVESETEVGREPRLYLVDPAQNFMKHYPVVIDRDKLLHDIKYLMKSS